MNQLINFAKNLRKEMTPWEAKSRYFLRAGRFYGLKSKRQVAFDKYIVDFCCNEKKLIIELDGSQHKAVEEIKKDKARDEYLSIQGYRILRFNNNEVSNNIEGVLETIRRSIN